MSNPARSPATPAKRGKGALITGVVLVVIGIALTLLGIAVPSSTAKEISTTQVTAPKPTPAEWTADLQATSTFGVYAAKDGAPVSASEVTVTAADGTPITVNTSDIVEVTGEGGQAFTEIAHFSTGTSGTFTIKVAAQGSTVAVAPSVSTASKGVAWIAALFVGPLLVLIGIVPLIVGGVRRSKS